MFDKQVTSITFSIHNQFYREGLHRILETEEQLMWFYFDINSRCFVFNFGCIVAERSQSPNTCELTSNATIIYFKLFWDLNHD